MLLHRVSMVQRSVLGVTVYVSLGSHTLNRCGCRCNTLFGAAIP